MAEQALVAGVDSSTQATKIVVCDSSTGEVVRRARADHPDATEVDPGAWWEALTSATNGLLSDVAAIGIAGQQHGMVALDDAGEVVRPALLWNDNRSAKAAADLAVEFGGPRFWARTVGSVPVASFTVSKLRWMAEHEPELADRVARVVLPHDWLTWRLLGARGEPTTDRGDASGTGYFAPTADEYRLDVLAHAFGGRRPGLPAVLGPAEPAGYTESGVLVSAGTGDNMAAALGLELEADDVVVSLGTSGTVFGVSDVASADPEGAVSGFADASGSFLPLACTLNAARVLTATAEMLGVGTAEFDSLASEAEPGAQGVTLLPYLDGERTPNLPEASGTLCGLRRANMTSANVARAAVEGMLCGLAAGLDAIREQGSRARRVLLIGGAAQSATVRAAAPGIFGMDVVVPEPGEYVARGAARQAAWALGCAPFGPPKWGVRTAETLSGSRDADAGAHVRSRYEQYRNELHGDRDGIVR